jgi:hypothetical protein
MDTSKLLVVAVVGLFIIGILALILAIILINEDASENAATPAAWISEKGTAIAWIPEWTQEPSWQSSSVHCPSSSLSLLR